MTVSASAAEGGDATILPADADGNAAGHQVRLDGAETEITVTAVRPPRADRTYTLQVTHAKPTVSIAASASTLAFHLQGIEFTVTRAAATAEALDVNLAFTQDQDFLPAGTLSRTVTIPADQSSATLSLASSDFSGGATSDGTLTATISADPAYAVGTDASASVAMVAANPAIVVGPGSTEHVFREDSGTQTISIVAETAAGVPEPTDATFRLLARTLNGTAVGGLDYGRIVYSFVNFQASDFAAQDGRYVATMTLEVTIIDDALAEDSEDFSLQLIPNGFPDAVSLAKADGSLCSSTCEWEFVIVDDDSPPAQVTGVVLTPGGGKLDVAWDEVTGADGYKVQWKSGTETFATAASDNRVAAVSPGSTTTHTISGIADGTDYTVRVIATRDGLEGTPSTEATERPDLRVLTIADSSATEGAAVAFTVTLSPAASADVTVGYAATDGTATSDSGHADGADYTAPVAGAQLTVLAGQTTGTISVATGDDTVDENDETFTVTLANPSSNAVLGTAKTATGTIEDDDVTAAEVSSIAFTSLPSDGEYDLGDTIEVSVTFDVAVDVTGTPRVGLLLDGTPAADSHALHDPGASSATVLVFRKTVTAADDDDADGIGVAANALELNGSSIVNQGTTEAAVLDHAAVSNGANVDTRWIESVAVTSTPTVPATVTGDPVYGPGETVRFTVKFESAVTVDTGSGVPALKFSASDSGRQDAAYESGSGGTDLVFAWTVPADVPGDEGAIGVPGNVDAAGTLLTNGGLVLNGGTIEDAGNRAVNVRHGSHTTGSLVDTTAPALAAGAGGAVVDGNELVLAFERASGVPDHLDEDSEPAPGDFTVTVQGTARAATGVDVDGASVTVTLAAAVGHAQHVTVGYAPGTDRLQDRWGNGVGGLHGPRGAQRHRRARAVDRGRERGGGRRQDRVRGDAGRGQRRSRDGRLRDLGRHGKGGHGLRRCLRNARVRGRRDLGDGRGDAGRRRARGGRRGLQGRAEQRLGRRRRRQRGHGHHRGRRGNADPDHRGRDGDGGRRARVHGDAEPGRVHRRDRRLRCGERHGDLGQRPRGRGGLHRARVRRAADRPRRADDRDHLRRHRRRQQPRGRRDLDGDARQPLHERRARHAEDGHRDDRERRRGRGRGRVRRLHQPAVGRGVRPRRHDRGEA